MGTAAIDSSIIGFAGLALVLTLTPGANMMLVIRSAITGGPQAGVATAAGVGTGHFAHAAASALGLSLFLSGSAAAFNAVKLAGAVYLAYLGIRSLASAWTGRGGTFYAVEGNSSSRLTNRRPRRSGRAYVDGLLCNILNPKVALFYLALLPQFIGPSDPVLPRSLLLAGIHALLSVSWQSAIALALGTLRPLLLKAPVRRALETATGALLVVFGVRLAFAGR
ncbi:MAG: LysE family translocator [Coriobacteriia bacterium]